MSKAVARALKQKSKFVNHEQHVVLGVRVLAARLVEQMSETGQQFLKLRMSLPTAPLLNFDVSVIRKSAAAKRAVWAVQFDATDSKTRMAVATHVLRVLREK